MEKILGLQSRCSSENPFFWMPEHKTESFPLFVANLSIPEASERLWQRRARSVLTDAKRKGAWTIQIAQQDCAPASFFFFFFFLMQALVRKEFNQPCLSSLPRPAAVSQIVCKFNLEPERPSQGEPLEGRGKVHADGSRAFRPQAAGGAAQRKHRAGFCLSVCLSSPSAASLGGSVGLVLLGTTSRHGNVQRKKGTFSRGTVPSSVGVCGRHSGAPPRPFLPGAGGSRFCCQER